MGLTKPSRGCFFTILLCAMAGNLARAQQLLVSDAKKVEIQNLAKLQDDTFKTNYQLALTKAKQHGWPLTRKSKGGIVVLQGVTPMGFPIYLRTDNNVTSAATTGTTAVQPGGLLGLNLSGSDPAMAGKLAIWDGGWVLAGHQEFSGKTITLKDASSSVIEHATHVAGTMVAKGIYAPAKGMAFGATTLQSYDFNSDVSEMTAASASLLLSNHSYGGESGWSFNDGQNRWEWYGLPGDTEDYTFGLYDDRCQAWDKIAYNAPYYLIVESAGNSRAENGPSIGDTYWGYRSRTDQTLINKGPRPTGISNNDSYDILNSTANAKNSLTVGAITGLPYGPASRTDVASAYFSAWGPTDDGRVKPDLVGAGVDVLSTDNTNATSYVTLSGTSMAAPNITGSLYLLQEYYTQKHPGSFMRSATLKGLACHTAFDGGNVGPDYQFGWGVLDMKKAAQALTDNGTKSLISEKTLTQGQTQSITVTASGSGILAATIAWTDVQGTPTTGTTINDRTPKLVNDLDIRVSDGTTTFKPWVLDPANPSLPATTGDNIRDNVEQVYVGGVTPGKTYTITVSHKGTLQTGQQAYSLIVTGIGGSNYCASAPASSADSRINNVTLSNLNNTPAAGCTRYSDYTNLTVELEQAKTYPISITAGTCGADFNKIAKVYIDYNADGVFDPVTELAATTTVFAATGTYTGNISIPATVVADSYSLMRVVLVESSSADNVLPCGAYAKGETQDYRVHFNKAATDAGVTAINTSTTGGICAGPTNLTIRLKNYGTDAISNIPVMVTVTKPDNSVVTFNETYAFTLAAQTEDDFTLQGTFNSISGTNYQVSATTNLPGDPVTANNQLSVNIATGLPASASQLQAYFCEDTKKYVLTGSADGGILWYKNTTDALPFTAGSPAYTLQAPVNGVYYAGVNDFQGTVGPAAKTAFTAGSYNQFTPAVYVRTHAPVLLESAKLYVGNAGKVTFTVSNTNGQIVSSRTINVTATRSTAAAGAQTDDAADQGRVYQLNLLFPSADYYTINVSYSQGATLFRSNAGVAGYPFNVAGVFSVIGNSAVNAAAPADTVYNKGFYYYLYNMQLKSAGCASTARVPVTVSKPGITQSDSLLVSNFPSGNQWFYEGDAIAGATGQTYAPLKSGNYQVKVTLASGCTIVSGLYRFARVPLHPDGSEIGLSVFPVPASSKINVLFNAPAANNLTLTLVNNAGQIVYTQKQTISAGAFSNTVDVSRQIIGTYILRVTLGNKSYGRKILVVK